MARYPEWTIAETETLRELYPRMSAKDIARVLQRSVPAIRLKAMKCKVQRDLKIYWQDPYADKQFSQGELGWTAGIIDGEGTMDLSYLSLTTRVCNTDKAMVDELDRLWGGSVHTGHTQIGTKLYCWKLSSQASFFCLQKVMPYLISKKEMSRICLEFRNTITSKIGNQYQAKYNETEKVQRRLLIEQLGKLKSAKGRKKKSTSSSLESG